jgi:hypothetical protein
LTSGRITGSNLLSGNQLENNTKRRGVLDEETLDSIGNSEAKLVTSFDNIMPFKYPVSLRRLREIGCTDGANFVTAKGVEASHLATIIKEGLGNG